MSKPIGFGMLVLGLAGAVYLFDRFKRKSQVEQDIDDALKGPAFAQPSNSGWMPAAVTDFMVNEARTQTYDGTAADGSLDAVTPTPFRNFRDMGDVAVPVGYGAV